MNRLCWEVRVRPRKIPQVSSDIPPNYNTHTVPTTETTTTESPFANLDADSICSLGLPGVKVDVVAAGIPVLQGNVSAAPTNWDDHDHDTRTVEISQDMSIFEDERVGVIVM
jgi:hypothetical protein